MQAMKAQANLESKQMREANKLTTNRKDTVAEVCLHLPSSVMQTKDHPLVNAVQVLRTRIEGEEDCKMVPPVEADDTAEEESVRGLTKWVRTSVKTWDETAGHYLPCEKRTELEPTVLVVWKAKELDDLIASGPLALLKRAQAIRSHFPTEQVGPSS